MQAYFTLIGLAVSSLASLFFSCLTYSLRHFSRTRLMAQLRRHNREAWFHRTVDNVDDLVFVTAAGRMLANIMILVCVLVMLEGAHIWAQYLVGIAISGIISLLLSVAIPHALAEHASSSIIALFVRLLHVWGWIMSPITGIMHWTDRVVRVMAQNDPNEPGEDIEEQIRSVVEEGEKEGVVDEQERQMIESVIEFRDTQVGQIMTARPEIIALDATASLPFVQRTIEETGHSRIPVYEKTLDHVIGVLYARDLLKQIGGQIPFDMRGVIRPPFFVPETKALRDLLQDFRDQKVHMAIVLDEYGGTAGLVTIEDVLEELVGEISDEHEPAAPDRFKRLDADSYEVDARVLIEEVNRRTGLQLPEESGYETVGGYVSNALGRIPEVGAVLDQHGAKFQVLAALPQRITRLRLEMQKAVASPSVSGGSTPRT